MKGRSLIMDDTRHLISMLKGATSPKYNMGKLQTLINYLKFHEYDMDFILSLDDPGPGLSEMKELFRRKLRL